MQDLQKVLFGSDDTQKIVAVGHDWDDAITYIRQEDGSTRAVRTPEREWMILPGEEKPKKTGDWEKLEGDGHFQWFAEFTPSKDFTALRKGYEDDRGGAICPGNPTERHLMLSGQTLFKGMAFSDLKRMQLDIETRTLQSNDPNARIFLISIITPAGDPYVLEGREQDILEEMVEIIVTTDPDVIEGHNIFGFDLPYIEARAKALKVDLNLGRDGSAIYKGRTRQVAIGGVNRPLTPFYIEGRHVIDTLLAVQRWDVVKGSLASYGLKECARALGISGEDRTMVDRGDIWEEYKKDPERVKAYALEDVRETKALAEIICPSDFYLTQMVPDSYQSVAMSGNGKKINSLLLRAYLAARQSIPKPENPKPVPGGFTEVRQAGVFLNVVKCDVESLYPSLMTTFNIAPKSEKLGIYLPMLRELTARRVAAKRKLKESEGAEKEYYDGLQNAFKIIINSFYGYLGHSSFNFNDYDAAAAVTTNGQKIVNTIADEIKDFCGEIIEIDTDGVYFIPPSYVVGEDMERSLVSDIESVLPEGIRLAHDGRWKTMISLKAKNYVLIGYDGKRTYKGVSMRSRADEPFGKEFLASAVDLLEEGKTDEVVGLYRTILYDILNKKLPPDKFARRQRVTQKTFTSGARKKFEVLVDKTNERVGDYIHVYRKEDGSLERLEKYDGDEDVKHLVEKLFKFASRLSPIYGERFPDLFPKPTAKGFKNLLESSEMEIKTFYLSF